MGPAAATATGGGDLPLKVNYVMIQTVYFAAAPVKRRAAMSLIKPCHATSGEMGGSTDTPITPTAYAT